MPSKVFLDAPLPTEHVRRVPICDSCNDGLSKDELYVACLLECARLGTTSPERHPRETVRRNMQESPRLRARIEASHTQTLFGEIEWLFEHERVSRVALKLVKGHIYLDLTAPQTNPPSELTLKPLSAFLPDQLADFELPRRLRIWPEVGSPAFLRATTTAGSTEPVFDWIEIQPGRYRYWVGVDPVEVRIVIGEHFAIRARWH